MSPVAPSRSCASAATNWRTDRCSRSSAIFVSPPDRHATIAASASAGTGIDNGCATDTRKGQVRSAFARGALVDRGDAPRDRFRTALGIEAFGIAVQRAADVVRESHQADDATGEAHRVAEEVV